MPGPTPHYPPEFKREVVELYRSSEKSIPKVAQELGIADESLRRWIRQHEVGAGEREGKRRKRSDPLDLAQEIGLWVVLLGDSFQLSVVVADALCKEADYLEDTPEGTQQCLRDVL